MSYYKERKGYYKVSNGNIYKLKKDKRKITYDDITPKNWGNTWEQYQGERYVAKNCALDRDDIYRNNLILCNDNIRLEIAKKKVSGIEGQYIYILSIYDNNWKECRDWNPNDPYYKGQIYSFSFAEDQQLLENFNEFNEFVFKLNETICLNKNNDFMIVRHVNKRDWDCKFIEINVINPFNHELFTNYPIFYQYYYEIKISYYYSKCNKINKTRFDLIKNKEKELKVDLILNPIEFNNLVSILSECGLTKINNNN